jgi:endoglucanase
MTGSDDFARPGLPEPTARAARLPRWRGFNLLEKFTVERSAPFREEDFRLIAEWGFDFARLPMDYRTWTDAQDLYRFKESVLAEIDQAVGWGERYGIHICLCLHRAPGYCVNRPLEPMDLWTDRQAQDACAYHWAHFARRYRGIPSARLSFNLVNEPKKIDEATYIGVASRLVSAIRTEDPDRLVIADGLDLAWTPVTGTTRLRGSQGLSSGPRQPGRSRLMEMYGTRRGSAANGSGRGRSSKGWVWASMWANSVPTTKPRTP